MIDVVNLEVDASTGLRQRVLGAAQRERGVALRRHEPSVVWVGGDNLLEAQARIEARRAAASVTTHAIGTTTGE